MEEFAKHYYIKYFQFRIPKFWQQIQTKMNLDSLNEIERFIKIIDFMGFTRPDLVAKLLVPRELDQFLIEAPKLNGNIRFRDKFGEVDTEFNRGDIFTLI